jgi:hypothetical protein
MTTPEGRVKNRVKDILAKYKVYYFMPVQTGYGAAGLDFHCVVRSKDTPIAFFIETKALDKELTARQRELAMELIKLYKAEVFIIDGFMGYRQLEKWLEQMTRGF